MRKRRFEITPEVEEAMRKARNRVGLADVMFFQEWAAESVARCRARREMPDKCFEGEKD